MIKHIEKRVIRRDFERARFRQTVISPYAVFFLHHQPEMNTVPEANIYADQFQSIKKLADSLPPGIKLFVREHPSTFTYHADRRWRPKGFYERITSLPNTHVCPADLDNFELIDRALFVASIAGVCLTEALARGKPAVIFFSPRFALFDDECVIDANLLRVSDLRKIFDKLALGERPMNRRKVRESFERVARFGYDGSQNESYLQRSMEETLFNTLRANLLAIRDFLSGRL